MDSKEPVVSTLNESFQMALSEVRATIEKDGYCSIREFKDIAEQHKVKDSAVLDTLLELGYTFVKTENADQRISQEVLVDLRYLAAAMLLIYSSDAYAKTNSVFEFVKGTYTYATWSAAFPMALRIPLLEDVYGAYGHHFTHMEIADNSVLVQPPDEELILKQVVRHSHALHELSKNDSELNAVFNLCVTTMRIVNNNLHDVHLSEIHRDFKGGIAYKHFWQLACKIVDKHRSKMRK